MSGGGLVEVLAGHWEIDVDNGGDQVEFFCDGCKETLAVGMGADVDALHLAHVEAAVLAWIGERLDGARDDVTNSIRRAAHDVRRKDMSRNDSRADAALTAVAEALGASAKDQSCG